MQAAVKTIKVNSQTVFNTPWTARALARIKCLDFAIPYSQLDTFQQLETLRARLHKYIQQNPRYSYIGKYDGSTYINSRKRTTALKFAHCMLSADTVLAFIAALDLDMLKLRHITYTSTGHTILHFKSIVV